MTIELRPRWPNAAGCAVLALVNLLALFGYRCWLAPRTDLVQVLESSLREGSTIERDDAFTWTFNVPMDQAGIERDAPGSFAPRLAGAWRWLDVRTLSFTPDRLPRATPIHCELSAERLRSRDGLRMPAAWRVDVRTPALRVVRCDSTACESGGRFVITIGFSDRVLPSEAFARLTLRDSAGHAIALDRFGEGGDHELTVITEPLAARADSAKGVHAELTVSAGLVGAGGPLGLEADVTRQLLLDGALRVEGVSAEPLDEKEGSIEVRLNHACTGDALRRVLSVDPPVEFTVSGGGALWRLHGPFTIGARYAVMVGAPPANAPPAEYPIADRFSAVFPDRDAAAWFDQGSGYLGARGHRRLLAHVVNLRKVTVTAWRVYDNNLVHWRTDGRWNVSSLGAPVAERAIELPGAKNRTHDQAIAIDEFRPALEDGVYRVALSWRPEDETVSRDDDGGASGESFGFRRYRGYRFSYGDEGRGGSAETVVTLSDLGLLARAGATEYAVWTMSLGGGRAAPGTRVRLFSSKNQLVGEAVSDGDGLARIPVLGLPVGEDAAVLIADRALAGTNELTWLDAHGQSVRDPLADTGGRPYLRGGHEAFVYADRGVYRPGETVHLRALVRGEQGLAPPSFPIRWRILRPDLRVWRDELALLPAGGDADLDLALPADLPTGHWTVVIGLPGSVDGRGDAGRSAGDETSFGRCGFQIEDFIPERMVVSSAWSGPGLAAAAEAAGSERRYRVAAGPPQATVRGDYLFGQPAAGREARLAARLDPARFSPVGWEEWIFADQGDSVGVVEQVAVSGERIELLAQHLDDHGASVWSLPVAERIAAQAHGIVCPWRLSTGASVLEVGGRAVNASSQVIALDPVDAYLGLRIGKAAAVGESQRFEVRMVSPDATLCSTNEAANATVTARLYREGWNTVLMKEGNYFHYRSVRTLDAVGEAKLIAIDAGTGAGELTVPDAGSFVLRLRDAGTGQVVSSRIYARGAGSWEDSVSREHPDRCEVAVERMDGAGDAPERMGPPEPGASAEALRVGDVALITVRSPFAGQLLVTVETDGVIASKLVEMTDSATTVRLPVTGGWAPDAFICATVIRAVNADLPWRVHRAFGIARARLDPADRRLEVNVSAPAEARPGTLLAIELALRGADGAPAAGAQATIAAVDEGVLRLTGFATPDPFAWFTAPRGLRVDALDCYDQLMPEVARPAGESPTGGDGGGPERHRSPIAATRVRPVALWSGVVHADAAGRAHVELPLPSGFSGLVRVMAVADHGAASGSVDRHVIVRAPVVLQTSWPRFAAPGDRFTVPVTVFNRTAADGVAEISITLDAVDAHGVGGPLAVESPTTAARIISGHDATVNIPIEALRRCGVAHARITATIGAESAVDEVELPVRPASPEMTFGDEAEAAPGRPVAAALGPDLLPGSVTLEATVGPHPSLSLPRGLDYLYRYPYGCAEQTVSACFPLIYLRDLGEAIAPGMFAPAGIAEHLRVGIQRLQFLQTDGGGIATWPNDREAWPWGTVYAAHFLIEARAAGAAVPEEFLARVLAYVRRIGDRNDVAWIETQCYATYVLALAGKPDHAAMHRLESALRAHERSPAAAAFASSNPGPSCRFHLSAAWLACGRRDLAIALIPDHLPDPRSDRHLDGDLASPVRDLAVLLSTLCDVMPDHPALPRLARELSDRRQWRSTQDTAFAVLALGKYLRKQAASPPCASMRLRIDGLSVAESAESAERSGSAVATSLAWHGVVGRALEATVEGSAEARAWVSWLATGVPMTPPADADHGIAVTRTWTREDGTPLGKRLVSGDLVLVTLRASSAIARDNIVLEDLLPAGFEVENPRLAGSAAAGQSAPWLRVDMRDDRVLVFGGLTSFWGHGLYELQHSYLARAVTPGTFVLPPLRAECLYDVSVSGIAGSGTVTIERRQ